MGAFVYMLKCADSSYYVGSATGDDLSLRIAQHQSGAFMGYTWSRENQSFWCGQNILIASRMQLLSSAKSRAGAAPRRKR